ncbi:MAG: UbiE/COQ5 methyltransferase [Candidatus Beckwithbacteria bacterium GW2011_GWB1_47_15]|uniref:UbiE/COQ5 methyltransferase n=1 Tax=Candidatus Beckwithbacteria bacterium GW2011_GWB1_47_15 TaxID=1618371 RepID=A0A0G1U687_9BACT|nr:MAG: UbiE/COQ5 methyltransferase, phosphoethanolamine N-methyltransferase [Candidatus Beckwithbacteria bacterium GW2011_GWC1_49_16]AQS30666.1 hypothetical protein [uncultured bacterium]KKU35854.1 MAG: UbiE/COQ5 methyltransferase [Candidatus Beckwithbacteria bacterium GW2011_GWA1_46_30]KKU61818.1 MAG: UbiE/COQ5 methyltransferase [Candidatus Beckwithbacteria bacterium GW2011_GWB1_47_15]KKU72628.1 MAG: UbiE/COQ5 methyltransferase [Candidatus Beckwithbacteria bacterium GW2011_GWA2_47_25]KKW0420
MFHRPKTAYKFKPPLFFDFLTPFYDLGNPFGLRKALHRRVFKHVKLSDRLKILDVGCGTGDDLLYLAAHYPKSKLYGLDADTSILQIARKKSQKAGAAIHFKISLAEKLPFSGNSFDLVWSSLMLHHLPTKYKKRALKEIYRVLKPRGRLILIDFVKPKNPVFTTLVKLQNLLEHTSDNYQGKIPIFVRQAGFKQLNRKHLGLNVGLIQAEK